MLSGEKIYRNVGVAECLLYKRNLILVPLPADEIEEIYSAERR
jgi:hypothetical protein